MYVLKKIPFIDYCTKEYETIDRNDWIMFLNVVFVYLAHGMIV